VAKNSVRLDLGIKGAITLQEKMLLLAITTILALVFRPTPSASQGDNTVTALPLTRPPRVINTSEQVCPSVEV